MTVCASHGMFSATSGTRIPRLCPVIPGIFIVFSFLLLLVKEAPGIFIVFSSLLLLVKEVLLFTSTLLVGASELADYNHTPKVLQMLTVHSLPNFSHG